MEHKAGGSTPWAKLHPAESLADADDAALMRHRFALINNFLTFGHFFCNLPYVNLTQLPEKQGFSWTPLAETVSLQTLEWECYILIISP